jgi:hypothetical protein
VTLREYYIVLGVAEGASHDEIETAWKTLALLHHPDRVEPTERAVATARMARINEAYDALRGEQPANPNQPQPFRGRLKREQRRDGVRVAAGVAAGALAVVYSFRHLRLL